MVKKIISTTYVPNYPERKELCVKCKLSLDVLYKQEYNSSTGELIYTTLNDNEEHKGCNRGYRLKGYNLDKCEILIVGEAPGFSEVEQAIPFIGKSGKILRENIKKLTSIDEDLLGWTNTVQCRPPGNSTPKSEYINACLHNLLSDIEKAKPKLIVAVGSIASKTIINKLCKSEYKFKSILMHHGRYLPKIFYKNVPVINIIHPAAYLHAENNQAKGITILTRIQDDIKYMEEIYNEYKNKSEYKQEKESLWLV